MRDDRPYSAGSEWLAPVGYGVRVDQPFAGFFRTKLRSGSVRVGVELRFGPPLDPVTGEELDRSWRWLAFVNGQAAELDTVWPNCAGEPISEAEYRRYCAQQTWAQQAAPESAYANPSRKIDLLSTATPLPF